MTELGRIFAAVALLATSSPAWADSADLSRAVAAYNGRDFSQAREILIGLLERRSLPSRADRITARTYLSACHYALGEIDLARNQLRDLFADAPGAPIDPKVFGAIRPTFIELAEEIRTDVAREHGETPIRSEAIPETSAGVQQPDLARRPPSLAFSFVPFGVGQFANDQTTKGAVFLGVEGLAFLTAGVSLALFESKKVSGHFLVDGRFAPQDVGTAYALQTTYLIAFWGGVAVAIGGVIDALFNRPSAPATVAAGPGSVVVRFW
jgi:hypothetical protein